VAQLQLLQTSSALLSTLLFGLVISAFCGPVVAVWVGHLPLIAAACLIGSPPRLLPTLQHASSTIYVVHALVGIGAGILTPGAISLFLLCIVDAGLTKEEAAAPMAVLTMVLPFAANAIAPLLTTVLADGVGVAFTGLAFVTLAVFSLVVSLMAHAQFFFSKTSDKISYNKPSAGAPSAGAPSAGAPSPVLLGQYAGVFSSPTKPKVDDQAPAASAPP